MKLRASLIGLFFFCHQRLGSAQYAETEFSIPEKLATMVMG